MAVFFSVVSKMVLNIDIFQGIVSKLVIPVSWQHYSLVCAQHLNRDNNTTTIYGYNSENIAACHNIGNIYNYYYFTVWQPELPFFTVNSREYLG